MDEGPPVAATPYRPEWLRRTSLILAAVLFLGLAIVFLFELAYVIPLAFLAWAIRGLYVDRTRTLRILGVLLFQFLGLFIAFAHFSRVNPDPHYSLLAALVAGHFGFTSVGKLSFHLANFCVLLGLVPPLVAVGSTRPRVQEFATVVSVAVWIVSALLLVVRC